MVIEHVAFQHPAPAAAAEWYAKHLGLHVARASDGAAQARFLADSAGHTVLEIYNNAAAPMPDYPAQSPLVLHVAFLSDDLDADSARLQAAGASVVEAPAPTPSGDTLAMLRDPWGIPLQLVRRASPLLA
ncbi:MAG: VOC family protein [Puniceicoccales bacterium]|jgi:catechol 2,3-dioxygenase-like lactoylglutathione lyase family enzyme|nr:VOC family protein [Puniceicoccales bacterium]